MATKAELEAELAKLRDELAAVKAAPRPTPAPVAPADTEASEEGETATEAPKDDEPDVLEALKKGDIEGIVQSLMDELEDLPSRKPLLTALGAFVVGYLIGRAGSKG